MLNSHIKNEVKRQSHSGDVLYKRIKQSDWRRTQEPDCSAI